MNDAVSTLRWLTPWRQVERPVADDPADLGTAFGLDLSMIPQDEAPADERPAAGSWIDRLTFRRS